MSQYQHKWEGIDWARIDRAFDEVFGFDKALKTTKETTMTMWDDAMDDCLSENKMHDEHYRDMPIEPLEVMQAVLTPEEYRGFLKGNIIKYSMRAGRKAGEPVDKEVDKARNYQQLLDAYDSYQE